jgi:electron transport complex protein RnfC
MMQNRKMTSISPEELAELFERYGAALPQCGHIIVSALDRDPDSMVNHDSLLNRRSLVLEGVAAIRRASSASSLILAVPTTLRHLVSDSSACEAKVVSISPKYPNGLPEVLAGRLHLDGGKCAFIDADRLADLVESFDLGQAVSRKHVTIVLPEEKARVISVDLGATVQSILDELKFGMESGDKIIIGGAMHGHCCSDPNKALPANVNVISIQKAKDVLEFSTHSCVNCGKCVEVCPMRLQASLISKYAEYSLFEMCRDLKPQACIGCGLCSCVCIAERPVSQLVRMAAKEVQIPNTEPKHQSKGGCKCPKSQCCC